MLKRLTIVGVGLIGGSLALALRKAHFVGEIIGVGRNEEVLKGAVQQGVIDRYSFDVVDYAQSDMIVLAVPVANTYDLLERMAGHLATHTVITDVGSVKQSVIAAATSALGERINQFVPGHPIAGSEKTSYLAADSLLFENKRVILTPLPSNDKASVHSVAMMWQKCGANVETMTPAEHDRVFAQISHLPHLLAFALMSEAGDRLDAEVLLKQAGSGFRDFTRIAGSSPEMWRDIFLSNREEVLKSLSDYQDRLESYQRMIAEMDGEALYKHLKDARLLRQAFASINIANKISN